MTDSSSMLVQQAMRRVSDNADRLVLPAIVAIYERPGGSDRATKQIGTGFRINWYGRPVLVTARHTLYGHRYDKEPEDPFAKHIVFDGRLRGLFELRAGEVGYLEGHDLAAVFVDELGLADSLSMSCLLPTEATCRLVTIYGLLSRGFRRQLSTGFLRPQPYIYTNKRAALGPGCTGVLLPKHRNRGGRTGKIVQAPLPVGLSGGPMLHRRVHSRRVHGVQAINGMRTRRERVEGQYPFGATARAGTGMIRITITAEAYAAIERTLPMAVGEW